MLYTPVNNPLSHFPPQIIPPRYLITYNQAADAPRYLRHTTPEKQGRHETPHRTHRVHRAKLKHPDDGAWVLTE